MKVKEALLDIVKINKVIVDNNLHQLLPRTKELQEAYTSIVKPLLSDFKMKYGRSERTLIKELLQNTEYRKIHNLKIQTFGNWGRKINPYIWASLFIEDESNSASDSLQLYILIDSTGLKFGFDYGDNIDDNHYSVLNIKEDETSQRIVLDAIDKNKLEVVNLKKGSPNIYYGHSISDNIIKTMEDFQKWNCDLHLIKSFELSKIPDDIEIIIRDVVNSLIPLVENVNLETPKDGAGYWLYSPGRNGSDWQNQYENGFMGIDYDCPDDLRSFSSREDLDKMIDENDLGSYNTSMALWQFANEINKGDVIVSKQGRSKYLGYGVVTSDYIYDETNPEYRHIRKVSWHSKGIWEADGNLPIKALTNITQYTDWISRLKNLLGIDSIRADSAEIEFNMEKALDGAFISKTEVQNIVEILATKKNIILQGSAGVGKTYIAKKIALVFQEDHNDDRIETIQFHQSYAYEDFIQGYRPNKDLFELKNGIFYEVCERAKRDSTSPYFLIIDEINRGNLSKIFGELMMLIESDKRGEGNQIRLAYSSSDHFYIPENLYLIGTMNTADRSLTIVDYALRRRFAFIKMKPNFDEPFSSFLSKKGLSEDIISSIIKKMKTLNNIIESDDSLGSGFEIGHSYFCSYKTGNQKKWLENVFKFEIAPLIEEYWFDDKQLIEEYTALINS